MIVAALEDLDGPLGAMPLTPLVLQTSYVHPVKLYKGRRAVVTSAFRTSSRPGHVGVDLLLPLLASDGPQYAPNTDGGGKWWFPSNREAVAVADGVVGRSLDTDTGGYIRIDHAADVSSQYMHLRQRFVKAGDRVRKGQPIGIIGAGDSHLVHLHFQIMIDGTVVDPAPLLAFMPTIADRSERRSSGGGGLLWGLAGVAAAGGAMVYYMRSRRRPIWR